MPSGWVSFILQEFGFEYRPVYPQELDAGRLAEKFDVLIFPDEGIPALRTRGGGRGGGMGPAAGASQYPPEYQDRVGSVTAEATVPRLREFLEAGGVIVTLEGSTSLAQHLGLPVSEFLVDQDGNPLRNEEFFVPGSLLKATVRPGSPVTHGLADTVIVNFAQSPVFRLDPGAAGIRSLAVYDQDRPLVSGWAWGQEKLKGGVAMLEARVGRGTLFLFGPQVTYRGQTHETYPLLFNGILLGGARETTLR
jgi:hypothetical protein